MSFPHEEAVEPAAAGIDGRRLQKVVRRFRDQQARGRFPGGQLAVRRRGRPVLDLAIGLARGVRPGEPTGPVEVRPGTPFGVLSAGKPLAAVVVALLEDRGELEVSAPVADLIPGFEAHGKGEITVLDVLTHRAGILLPDLVRQPELWGDREAVLRCLLQAEPTYERGTFAYMPYEYGWILDEVVARVTGRPLHACFAEEVADPLGLPGLRFGLGDRDPEELAYAYWLGASRLVVGGVDVAAGFEERNNSREQLESQNPAVSLVADAASLAAFYEFLVGGGLTRTGTRLLAADTLRRYTTRVFVGWDRNSKALCAMGRGCMVGARFPTIYGWWGTGSCFGHAGGLSTLAFADHRSGLAAAIVTNGHRSFADLARRFMPLAQGLRRACW